MRTEASAIDSGMEVFGMEILEHGDVPRAVRAALESAIAVTQRAVHVSIRDTLLEAAEDIDDSDTDFLDDGPGCLLWFAFRMDQELPFEYQKDNDGHHRPTG